jgi:hypothetical protein
MSLNSLRANIFAEFLSLMTAIKSGEVHLPRSARDLENEVEEKLRNL